MAALRRPPYQSKIIFDDAAPRATGYGESKCLAELLLDHAVQKFNINVSVARIGQMAGAVERPGLWKKAEWVPKSCNQLASLGRIARLSRRGMGSYPVGTNRQRLLHNR